MDRPTSRVSRYLPSAVIVGIVLMTILIIGSSMSSDRAQLVLATTTSTYDSGLLDDILPDFESKYDVEVKVIAVGTGQALRLGEAGDADVLLVHAPDKEIEFVSQGHGLFRQPVMYNGFIVVGPSSDPAGINGIANATEAFRAMHDRETKFCSRGDDSGTHSREQKLWEQAGFSYDHISSKDSYGWYLSVGQGMGDTLRLASDLGAYALTDEGTYLAMSDDLDLVVHVSGGEELRNQYSVIPVNGSRHGNVNTEMAMAFSAWLSSEGGQALIDAYTRDGRALFVADARDGIP